MAETPCCVWPACERVPRGGLLFCPRHAQVVGRRWCNALRTLRRWVRGRPALYPLLRVVVLLALDQHTARPATRGG